MTVRKFYFIQFVMLISMTFLVGCSATNTESDFDQSLILIKDTNAPDTVAAGEDVSVRVDGEKLFFDRPNSFVGGIFKLKLDLEDMQQKCALRVFGEKVDFSAGDRATTIVSRIEDYEWAVHNVGLLGQNASVSFSLSVEGIRDQRKIYGNETTVEEYRLEEAEFETHQEIFLAPVVTAFTGKADRFALAAFMATTKHVCEEYQKALTAISAG